MGVAPGGMAEVNRSQRGGDPGPDLRRRQAKIFEREGDFVFDGGGDQLGGRLLKDDPDLPSQGRDRVLGGFQPGDGEAAEKAAFVELRHDPIHRQAEGRLPRAGRADQTENLSARDRKIDMDQRGCLGLRVGKRDLFQYDQRLRHRATRGALNKLLRSA